MLRTKAENARLGRLWNARDHVQSVVRVRSSLIHCLLVSSFSLQACFGRVDLSTVPPNASEQERNAAYERLRPVSHEETISITVHKGTLSTWSSRSLILANGDTVHDASDLQPVLAPNTVTARKIRDYESAKKHQLIWGGISVLIAGAALVISRDEIYVSSEERLAVSMGTLAASLCPLAVSFGFAFSAKSHKAAAFATYDRSLRETLNLCVRGDRLIDCNRSAVSVAVRPAHRDVDQPRFSQTAAIQSSHPSIVE